MTPSVLSIGGVILASEPNLNTNREVRTEKRERLRSRLLLIEDNDQVDCPLRRIQAEGTRQGLAIG
jgi:hypothetical protein